MLVLTIVSHSQCAYVCAFVVACAYKVCCEHVDMSLDDQFCS